MQFLNILMTHKSWSCNKLLMDIRIQRQILNLIVRRITTFFHNTSPGITVTEGKKKHVFNRPKSLIQCTNFVLFTDNRTDIHKYSIVAAFSCRPGKVSVSKLYKYSLNTRSDQECHRLSKNLNFHSILRQRHWLQTPKMIKRI